MSIYTKEGIEVKVGQVWLDLDKRMDNRKRIVTAIDVDYAVMGNPTMPSAPKVRLAIRRMHKSSTGWALVPKYEVENTEEI